MLGSWPDFSVDVDIAWEEIRHKSEVIILLGEPNGIFRALSDCLRS